ncbi:MAG TPA: RNA polymerase sigma factor WhiG, partial [Verrucomicrobia bacterium]|nr:RNA polymerase sigma factor WhiG [Verrucomicrobiota bacterium]
VRNERGALFRKAFRKLNDRQQKILYLYYYEELTLKEIGTILDLTEARICQLHAGALLVLRGMLQGS